MLACGSATEKLRCATISFIELHRRMGSSPSAPRTPAYVTYRSIMFQRLNNRTQSSSVLKHPGHGKAAPSRGQPKRKHLELHGSTLRIKQSSSSKSCRRVNLGDVTCVEPWGDSDCNLKLGTAQRTFWLAFESSVLCSEWLSLISLHALPSKMNRAMSVRAEVFDKVELAGVDATHHGANPLFEEDNHDAGG